MITAGCNSSGGSSSVSSYNDGGTDEVTQVAALSDYKPGYFNFTKLDDIPQWAKSYFSDGYMELSQLTEDERKESVRSKLLSIFSTRASAGTQDIIIRLNTEFVPEGFLTSEGKDYQRSKIAAVQDKLTDAIRLRASGSLQVIEDFGTVPFAVIRMSSDDVDYVSSLSSIYNVEQVKADKVTLGESNPLIGSDVAWSTGVTGAGQVVAVLDTGVDKSHTFLSGKVVSEACYSNDGGNGGGISVCPGGVSSSTASGSGVNCSLSITGCDHGTHVAGIVAGDNGSIYGVAKNSGIIAVQVFTNIGGKALSYNTDQIRGMERVYNLRNTFNIAAVNMSLGGGKYTSYCDSDSRKIIIDNLRSVGIATVIASGNDGYTNAVSSPGCISTAITVGSTQDGSGGTVADRVSAFSNSASLVDLLAPGEWITSSVPGNAYATWRGTSMATPHVAGAFALIKSAVNTATVTEIESALKVTGKSVTDSKNSVTKPRINVDDAIVALGQGSITVNISPANAVSDGAQWKVDGGSWQNSGATVDNLFVGSHTLYFKTTLNSNSSNVWITPANVTSVISSDGDSVVENATYQELTKNITINDATGDGKADILFRKVTSGKMVLWEADGPRIIQSTPMELLDGTIPEPDYDVFKIVGFADATGDGKSDILFRKVTSGKMVLWETDGHTITASTPMELQDGTIPEPDYNVFKIVGFADATGDGKADILFRKVTSGKMVLWETDGHTITASTPMELPDGTIPEPDYDVFKIVGFADATGDGKADILFRKVTSGKMVLWETDGHTITASTPMELQDGTIPEPDYNQFKIKAFADFTGDGKADILFRQVSTGKMVLWETDGHIITASTPMYLTDGTVPTPDYSVFEIDN